MYLCLLIVRKEWICGRKPAGGGKATTNVGVFFRTANRNFTWGTNFIHRRLETPLKYRIYYNNDHEHPAFQSACYFHKPIQWHLSNSQKKDYTAHRVTFI